MTKDQNDINDVIQTSSYHLIMNVFEHQRLTINDFSHTSDFTWLLEQEFAVFSLKRQRGQWQLKVGHYIGVVRLPSGMTLEILPKLSSKKNKDNQQYSDEILITRQWVQRMLTDLTTDNATKTPHSIHLNQLSDALEPLSMNAVSLSEWILTQFLQHLVHYRPTRAYQTQIHNQSVLQGKLLIKEQLRHNRTQPYKFMSEVNVLSQDMLGNRIIKSALLLLESLVSSFSSHFNQSSSTQIIPTLSAVLSSWRQTVALYHHELGKLAQLYTIAKRQLNLQSLPRQQLQSAQQLLELSYWLLQKHQPAMPTGNGFSQLNHSSQLRLCLLINMNQAFEQWASMRIGTLFKQLDLSYQPLYQAQHSWLTDEKNQTCLSVRPDLLIQHFVTEHNQVCSYVIDIKWKDLSGPSEISASDIYQLISYSQAYQSEHVWLVYPVSDDKQRPVMLRQHTYGSLGYSNPHQVKLWLMPFNVLTGTLNHWSHQSISDRR